MSTLYTNRNKSVTVIPNVPNGGDFADLETLKTNLKNKDKEKVVGAVVTAADLTGAIFVSEEKR